MKKTNHYDYDVVPRGGLRVRGYQNHMARRRDGGQGRETVTGAQSNAIAAAAAHNPPHLTTRTA